MPRDRSDWNRSIDKGITTLQNGEPGSLLLGSIDAFVSVLQTSNLAESTQSTSNSLAASRELCHARDLLRQGLVQYEDDEDIDTPNPVLLDYIGRIEQYSNHRLSDNLTPYRLPYLDWQKVCLAAQAAKYVHKMDRTSEDALFVPGSTFGTMKPYACFKHTLDGAQYLVVAIRATRTIWDWMVNSNSKPAECIDFGNTFKCHEGFLFVARNMKAAIEDCITEQIATLARPTNVIFAGHSAGAAVAQLLFSLIYSDSAVDFGPKVSQIDCITFGGPPTTFPPLPIPPSCLFLDIKNEGDPATLAQRAYIESLLIAYAQKPPRAKSSWRVPRPFYYSSGDQILLRDVAEEDSDAEDPAAFRVDDDEMKSVIFGNPVRHSMTLCLRRVEAIRDQTPKSISSDS